MPLVAASQNRTKSNQITYLVAALASLDVDDLAHDAEVAVDCEEKELEGMRCESVSLWIMVLLFGTTALLAVMPRAREWS